MQLHAGVTRDCRHRRDPRNTVPRRRPCPCGTPQCPPNSRAWRLCVHPFDPLSTECGSQEWIRKVLRFPRDLVAPELHDAHGVGRLAVIGQDELGDPKLAAANDSSDGKPLFARLTGALILYVASTAGSLTRLRVFQHGVLEVDAVLGFKIVGIGRRPMLLEGRTDLCFLHGWLWLCCGVHVRPPLGMKPGTPVRSDEH